MSFMAEYELFFKGAIFAGGELRSSPCDGLHFKLKNKFLFEDGEAAACRLAGFPF